MNSIENAFEIAIKKNLGAKEASILFDFVKEEIFVGDYYTRVPICKNHIRMDVVCIEGPKTTLPISVYGKLGELRKYLSSLRSVNAWVLEIKEMSNFEALGQILVDKYYFPREYPNISTECFGILCRSSDQAIEKVCKNFGIEVFEVKGYE